MLKNKAIYAIGITFLFVALAMTPASANPTSKKIGLCEQESSAVARLFNEIELAASNAHNYQEFLKIIRDLFKNNELETFPILKYILEKILSWITTQRELYFGGKNINDFFNRFNLGFFNDWSKHYFVFSCGSYNRWNPRKENEIKLYKPGFEFWRYSGKSKLFKGRTLIIERQPFGIKQRVMGSQIGVMTGFRGLYIDRESKLTGTSYNLFIGRANRIRALDITPFSD
jgi:hypothetical protein